jgi:hypothetical protein
VSCKKATDVAKKMPEIFKDKLVLYVHRTDSQEALLKKKEKTFVQTNGATSLVLLPSYSLGVNLR